MDKWQCTLNSVGRESHEWKKGYIFVLHVDSDWTLKHLLLASSYFVYSHLGQGHQEQSPPKNFVSY